MRKTKPILLLLFIFLFPIIFSDSAIVFVNPSTTSSQSSSMYIPPNLWINLFLIVVFSEFLGGIFLLKKDLNMRLEDLKTKDILKLLGLDSLANFISTLIGLGIMFIAYETSFEIYPSNETVGPLFISILPLNNSNLSIIAILYTLYILAAYFISSYVEGFIYKYLEEKEERNFRLGFYFSLFVNGFSYIALVMILGAYSVYNGYLSVLSSILLSIIQITLISIITYIADIAIKDYIGS